MTISTVRKFIVALTAAGALAGAALADGSLDSTEAIQVTLAFLASIGVYAVPND